VVAQLSGGGWVVPALTKQWGASDDHMAQRTTTPTRYERAAVNRAVCFVQKLHAIGRAARQ